MTSSMTVKCEKNAAIIRRETSLKRSKDRQPSNETTDPAIASDGEENAGEEGTITVTRTFDLQQESSDPDKTLLDISEHEIASVTAGKTVFGKNKSVRVQANKSEERILMSIRPTSPADHGEQEVELNDSVTDQDETLYLIEREYSLLHCVDGEREEAVDGEGSSHSRSSSPKEIAHDSELRMTVRSSGSAHSVEHSSRSKSSGSRRGPSQNVERRLTIRSRSGSRSPPQVSSHRSERKSHSDSRSPNASSQSIERKSQSMSRSHRESPDSSARKPQARERLPRESTDSSVRKPQARERLPRESAKSSEPKEQSESRSPRESIYSSEHKTTVSPSRVATESCEQISSPKGILVVKSKEHISSQSVSSQEPKDNSSSGRTNSSKESREKVDFRSVSPKESAHKRQNSGSPRPSRDERLKRQRSGSDRDSGESRGRRETTEKTEYSSTSAKVSVSRRSRGSASPKDSKERIDRGGALSPNESRESLRRRGSSQRESREGLESRESLSPKASKDRVQSRSASARESSDRRKRTSKDSAGTSERTDVWPGDSAERIERRSSARSRETSASNRRRSSKKEVLDAEERETVLTQTDATKVSRRRSPAQQTSTKDETRRPSGKVIELEETKSFILFEDEGNASDEDSQASQKSPSTQISMTSSIRIADPDNSDVFITQKDVTEVSSQTSQKSPNQGRVTKVKSVVRSESRTSARSSREYKQEKPAGAVVSDLQDSERERVGEHSESGDQRLCSVCEDKSCSGCTLIQGRNSVVIKGRGATRRSSEAHTDRGGRKRAVSSDRDKTSPAEPVDKEDDERQLIEDIEKQIIAQSQHSGPPALPGDQSRSEQSSSAAQEDNQRQMGYVKVFLKQENESLRHLHIVTEMRHKFEEISKAQAPKTPTPPRLPSPTSHRREANTDDTPTRRPEIEERGSSRKTGDADKKADAEKVPFLTYKKETRGVKSSRRSSQTMERPRSSRQDSPEGERKAGDKRTRGKREEHRKRSPSPIGDDTASEDDDDDDDDDDEDYDDDFGNETMIITAEQQAVKVVTLSPPRSKGSRGGSSNPSPPYDTVRLVSTRRFTSADESSGNLDRNENMSASQRAASASSKGSQHGDIKQLESKVKEAQTRQRALLQELRLARCLTYHQGRDISQCKIDSLERRLAAQQEKEKKAHRHLVKLRAADDPPTGQSSTPGNQEADAERPQPSA